MRHLLSILPLFLLGCAACTSAPYPAPDPGPEAIRHTVQGTVMLRQVGTQGVCSGWWWKRRVVTAAHCLGGQSGPMEVKGPWDPQWRPAHVVEVSLEQDLALLVLSSHANLPNGLQVAHCTPSEGSRVYQVGHPLGVTWTVTEGIVSSRQRTMGGRVLLQTDAHVSPGNSGGPVVDRWGQVIGVASVYLSHGILAHPLPHLGFATHLGPLRSFLGLPSAPCV